MTAAEQQISGNPAAMESAQARTTVTDQAKVQDIISRVDRAHETPMFHRIVALVAAGMLMDSIDVYIGSAVASSALATHWSDDLLMFSKRNPILIIIHAFFDTVSE